MGFGKKKKVSGERIDLWIFPNLKRFFGSKGYCKRSNDHSGSLRFFQLFSHRLLESEIYYKMFRDRKIGLHIGFKIIEVPYLEFQNQRNNIFASIIELYNFEE